MKTEVEPIISNEWYNQLQADPASYANIAMQLQSKLRMMQQRIDQLTTVSPKRTSSSLTRMVHTIFR